MYIIHSVRHNYLHRYVSRQLLCFAQDCWQQCGLTGAHLSNNSHERTLLYLEVDAANRNSSLKIKKYTNMQLKQTHALHTACVTDGAVNRICWSLLPKRTGKALGHASVCVCVCAFAWTTTSEPPSNFIRAPYKLQGWVHYLGCILILNPDLQLCGKAHMHFKFQPQVVIASRKQNLTTMWADAKRDGRPAECR